MVKRHDLMRLARVILLVAPWAFILYAFRDVGEVVDLFSDASVALMLVGSLLTLAAIVGFAVLWIRLLRHLNRGIESTDVPHILRAYARSWLARYVPGKVWSLGARVVYTDVRVMPRRIVARGLVYELAAIMASATALGFGFWTWGVVGPTVGLPLLLAGTAAVIVLVWRLNAVTNSALGLIRKAVPQRWTTASDVLKEARQGRELGAKGSILFTCGYLLCNLALALGFVLIAASLAEVGWADVPVLAGGYSLAAVLGMVAFFAPAGLGVREGILVGFSAAVLTAPEAVSAVILVRLINIFADLIFVGLVEGSTLLSRPIARGSDPGSEAGGRQHQTAADPPGGSST